MSGMRSDIVSSSGGKERKGRLSPLFERHTSRGQPDLPREIIPFVREVTGQRLKSSGLPRLEKAH